MSERRINTLLGFVAIAGWSTLIGVSRSLMERIGPATSAALVFLLGGVIGLVYQAGRGRLRGLFAGLDRRYLFLCGLLFLAYECFLYLGLGLAADRIRALEVSMLNYLWPMLTVVFSLIFMRMAFGPLLWAGLLLGTAGAFLSMVQGQSFSGLFSGAGAAPLPYLLGFGAALCWGLYSSLSRKWAEGKDTGAVPLFMLATGLVMGLVSLGLDEPSNWSWAAAGELVFMVLVPTMSYMFWEAAMRKGDIVLVASCSYFTPFLSALITCAYLNIAPGPGLWAGCVMIIAGAFVVKRSVRGA